jgi:uncharacterized protein (DUF924 family)
VLRNKIAIGAHMPENLQRGNAVNDKDIVKQGYLEKSDPRGSNWNKRYCVLSKDGRLIYYTDKGKDARGVADLCGAKAEIAQAAKKPFGFNVIYPGDADRRKFFFATVSNEESKDWIDKINSVSVPSASKNIAVKRKVAEEKHKHTGDESEDPQIQEILGYWFQGISSDDTELLLDKHANFWFLRNNLVDDLIRNNFYATWEKAVRGELDSWANSPRGTVALIILLDQFTRNMFRDSPKMFSGDAKAFEIAEKALANGTDKKLPAYQRCWFYLVFQRKEDIKALEKAAEHFSGLQKEANARGKSQAWYERGAKVASEQLDLIKRFGRFPVRNAILGRQSTNDEVDYLLNSKKYFST